ncbi:MAG: hypothetical protein VKO39_12820 [Cyanobacteriota bacterium]|nr:hypothetical protein [Cyanobacteriota bacterium]
MTALTGAQRQKRLKDRKRGRLAPAKTFSCEGCGKLHKGAHGKRCRQCWLKTPDGRARVAHLAARLKARNLTITGRVQNVNIPYYDTLHGGTFALVGHTYGKASGPLFCQAWGKKLTDQVRGLSTNQLVQITGELHCRTGVHHSPTGSHIVIMLASVEVLP